MSPNLRRALHEALDLVLNAIASEGRDSQPKARRTRPAKVRQMPPHIDEAAIARAAAAGKKAGLL